MTPIQCRVETDVLFVIDVQTPLFEVIADRERLLRRAGFLIQAAIKMGVPVIWTEQVPQRLGPTHPYLAANLPGSPFAKNSFSCMADEPIWSAWRSLNRPKAILVGIETHICVCTTALDLLREEAEVVVCPDAVSSRSMEAHKLGMERMRDSGVIPSHTETVVYEWLGSSENPHFRDVLQLVKAHPL